MIAVRNLPLDEVERRLWRLKCRKLKEYETAALWETHTGYKFTVPQMDADKRCDQLTFNSIIDDIRPYLPPDADF